MDTTCHARAPCGAHPSISVSLHFAIAELEEDRHSLAKPSMLWFGRVLTVASDLSLEFFVEFELERMAARITDSHARLKQHQLLFSGEVPFGYDAERGGGKLIRFW